ncbi:hypothetical protein ABJI51_03860 [Amycolatopsis sp. NEAU-NG30]|uniref:Uncharacterized protein n=1 Tax=Amycolatopsis melonis TaxID=3156488 RepID=A0ABV0L7D4_9PSEU
MEYVLSGEWRRERDRLAAIEVGEDPVTIDVLARTGARPGRRCAEVGAGGGSIAEWLVRTVGPDGRWYATDLDTRFLTTIDAETSVQGTACRKRVEFREILDRVPDGEESKPRHPMWSAAAVGSRFPRHVVVRNPAPGTVTGAGPGLSIRWCARAARRHSRIAVSCRRHQIRRHATPRRYL